MNGYELTEKLYQKIGQSPSHTLPLEDALMYIEFYGLKDLMNANGRMRIVGQVAIDALDKAISFGLIKI